MDNTELFFLIYSLSHQSAFLDQLMIFCANYLIYFAALWMLIGFFRGSTIEKRALPQIIIGAVLANFLILFAQKIYPESRPFVELHISPLISMSSFSPSFPSIHTTLLAVMAFTYLFLKAPFSGVAIILLIITGLARIYCGVHYPVDILGGIIIGFISAWLSQLVFVRLKYRPPLSD